MGKTTIARNIADQAVLAGHTVRCTSAGHMLNELAGADGDHALRHRLASYARPRLLLIDEIGYLSYSNRHADLLFEIVSRRYQEKSTLVTTNRPQRPMGEVFPNAACVVSLIDRLVHHAEIIAIEGESYRLKEAKEHAEQRRRQRAAPQVTTPPPLTHPPPKVPMYPPPTIPDDWSAEQAAAVQSFRATLLDGLWERYQEPLRAHYRAAREAEQYDHAQRSLDLVPRGNDVPF